MSRNIPSTSNLYQSDSSINASSPGINKSPSINTVRPNFTPSNDYRLSNVNAGFSSLPQTSVPQLNVISLDVSSLQARYALTQAEVERLLGINNALAKECEDLRRRCAQAETASLGRFNAGQDQLLKDKDREIEVWKQKYATMDANYTRQITDMRFEIERTLRIQIENELRSKYNVNNQFRPEDATLRFELDKARKMNDELTGKIALLGMEVDRLSNLVEEERFKNSDLQRRQAQQGGERVKRAAMAPRDDEDNNKQQEEIKQLKQQLQERDARINGLLSDLNRLQEQLNKQIQERDARINGLLSDINRLQEQLNQRAGADGVVRQLEDRLREYERKLNALTQENSLFVDRLKNQDDNDRNMKNLIARLQELEPQNKALREENDELTYALRQKENANGQAIEQRNLQLINEINQLRAELDRRKDYDVLRRRIQDLENAGLIAQQTEERIKILEQKYSSELNALRVELERRKDYDNLKKENEALSRKIREYEASILTLQQNLERANREVEQLLAKNQNLQQTLKEYELLTNTVRQQEEMLKELTEEINRWKNKYERFEKEKKEEIDRLRAELEERLRAEYESRYNDHAQGFENYRVEYEAIILSLKEKIVDFEEKLYMLLQENSYLKGLLSERDAEIEILKNDEARLKEAEEFKKALKEAEKKADKEKAELQEIHENELKGEKRKLEELKKDLEAEKEHHAHTVEELRKYYESEKDETALKHEKEKNEILKKIDELNKEHEKEIKELEKKHEKEKEELLKKIEELKKEHKKEIEEIEERHTDELKRLENEIKKLESEKADLLKRLKEIDERLAELQKENARLVVENKQKVEETEQWKKKYNDLQRDTQAYIEKIFADIETQFKSRLDQEKDEYHNSLTTERQQVEQQIAVYVTKIKHYETEISHLIEANERLTHQAEELLIEQRAQKVKTEGLLKEHEVEIQHVKLMVLNEMQAKMEKEREESALKVKQAVGEYEQEIIRLRDVIQELQTRQVMFFIEIERLYAINSEFIDELNTMHIEVEALREENANLKQQIAEMNQAILVLQEERMRFESAVNELTYQISEHEKRIQLLINENARLSDLSLSRLREIDELKNSYNSRTIIRDEQSTKQVADMKKSQADMKEMAIMFETEKNNMESQLKQLKTVIDLNRMEIMRLQELNQQRRLENEELQKEVSSVKGSSSLVNQLQSDLALRTKQYEQCLKEVDEMRKNRDFFRAQLEQTSLRANESLNERVKERLSRSSIGPGFAQYGGRDLYANMGYTTGGSQGGTAGINPGLPDAARYSATRNINVSPNVAQKSVSDSVGVFSSPVQQRQQPEFISPNRNQ